MVDADYAMDQAVVTDPAYSSVIEGSLTTIPTLSIALDPDDLFGGNGIYDKSTDEGFERSAAIELIYPDGREGCHADCSIKPHSRFIETHLDAESALDIANMKRSFRLSFKSEYGDAKLAFPFFESAPCNSDSAPDELDRLVLRAGSNRSYAGPVNLNQAGSVYSRDQWGRDAQIEMSGDGVHGTFVHLYLNGLYWGVYNACERPDKWFAAKHFGGEPEHWYAHNHSGDVGQYDDPESSRAHWRALLDMCADDTIDWTTQESYADVQDYLELPAFCDYVLTWWMCGGGDWDETSVLGCNNFYALNRNSPQTGPTRYFCWDMEMSWLPGEMTAEGACVHQAFLVDSRSDAGKLVAGVFRPLWQNEEFRVLFADRLYQHVHGDGALSDKASQARWTEQTAFIADAMVAESARWGDSKQASPIDRDTQWYSGRDYVYHLMDGNTVRLVGACRMNGIHGHPLYPMLDPPELVFNQGQGTVTMTSSGGAIYYTMDGTDPRFGGVPLASGSSVPVVGVTTLKVRTRSGAVWSALNERTFMPDAVERARGDIRISELMYNPPDGQEFEFIELFNAGNCDADISNWQFSDGIAYTFAPGTVLPAGGYLVLACNVTAFQNRYPDVPCVGPFEPWRLENSPGERIELEDAGGQSVIAFTYQDENAWPQHRQADGDGYSLVLVDTGTHNPSPENASDWRVSAWQLGSPGAPDVFSRTLSLGPPSVGLPGTQLVIRVSGTVDHVLEATVESSGQDVQYLWEQVDNGSLPIIGFSDRNAASPTVSFDAAGTYQFRFEATCGDKSSVKHTIVKVVDKPSAAHTAFWLNPGNISPSGGGVEAWGDATAATPVAMPTYETLAFRGHAGVRFDGVNDILTMHPASCDSCRMLALSFRTGPDVEECQVVYEEGGDTAGRCVYIEDGLLHLKAWSDSQSPPPMVAGILANMQYTVQFVTQQPALQSWINGQFVGAVNISDTSSPYEIGVGGVFGQTRIGGHVLTSDLLPFEGMIIEVIRSVGPGGVGDPTQPLTDADVYQMQLYQLCQDGVAGCETQYGAFQTGNTTEDATSENTWFPEYEDARATLVLGLSGYHAFLPDANGPVNPAIIDEADDQEQPSPPARVIVEPYIGGDADDYQRWIRFTPHQHVLVRPEGEAAFGTVGLKGLEVDVGHEQSFRVEVIRSELWASEDDAVIADVTWRVDEDTIICEPNDDPDALPVPIGDEVELIISKTDMVAYRPTTEGPAYWSPFGRRAVPEDVEGTPGHGAGIRLNGDDDNENGTADRYDAVVAGENDLIEVTLHVGPAPSPSGIEYVLKRSGDMILVWENQTKGGEILGWFTDEATISVPSGTKTVWVEAVDHGHCNLELIARASSSGMAIHSDRVHFDTFSSVVIVFHGENGQPHDPPNPGTGMDLIALDLYTSGYDVHAYDEPDIHDIPNTEDIALDEIESAFLERGVTSLGMIGYSHGGGSVYRVSDALPSPLFHLDFTAYIDAISQPLLNITAETRRPLDCAYHVNYHQSADHDDAPLYLDGAPSVPATGSPGYPGHEDNVDEPTVTAGHVTIDDSPMVIDGVLNSLKAYISP